MNTKNFFAELRRRNVYKVVIAYAIVGWLVMQIAATVVPALHLSDAITSARYYAKLAAQTVKSDCSRDELSDVRKFIVAERVDRSR